MEEIDILKKLKISNGVNGLSKEGDLLSEIIKVKWLSMNSCVSYTFHTRFSVLRV